MVVKSEACDTLLVTIVMPTSSAQMKSTATLDLMFLKFLLMLATCIEEFFINLTILLLLIGMMTCLYEDPLVVILICYLALGKSLTISLI